MRPASRALAALSLCVTVWRFEQPVGQTSQGFVNEVVVEACPWYPEGAWMLRATETMRDGTTGRAVGSPRVRVFSRHQLEDAAKFPPGTPAQEPGSERNDPRDEQH